LTPIICVGRNLPQFWLRSALEKVGEQDDFHLVTRNSQMKILFSWVIRWTICFSIVQVSLVAVSDAQWATNPEGDLFGENLGNSIILQWNVNDKATEYIVYRSTSINGPWEVNGRFPQSVAGRVTEEITPDAHLIDLCYKVEATDTTKR
jgi:hypothetical protein